jgi:hypothetical protein
MGDSKDYADAMRQRFLVVVNELRAALGYAINESDPEPGDELVMEMMYGNFDFAVVHSLNHRPGTVLLECQFGEVPAGREEAILQRLLQMNTALGELEGSAFCLDSGSGNLVYTLPMNLDRLDGDRLLRKMTETVWHGRRWLETRFLAETHRSGEALPDPVQLA